MEQRLKNIGDLADAITTLSQAVLNLAKRVEALEEQVQGLENMHAASRGLGNLRDTRLDMHLRRIEELESRVDTMQIYYRNLQGQFDKLVDYQERFERQVNEQNGQTRKDG